MLENNKNLSNILAILGVVLIIFVAAEAVVAMREIQYVGQPDALEHQITVTGEARVSQTPDLATVRLGVESKAASVDEAQTQNTATMNPLIEKVKALGIDDDDVQTSNYNVHEDFKWNPDTRINEPVGWVVNQTITVKVRDIDLVSSVLGVAGKNGATSINGPDFTIDDPTILVDAAREKAIADAGEQADELARVLNIKFDQVVSYDEWVSGGDDFPRFAESAMFGLGGAGPEPAIAPGSEERILHVTITYRLRN